MIPTFPSTVSAGGAYFRSYRDGTVVRLTPESSVQAQKAYGADIIIPLDHLPPFHIDKQTCAHPPGRPSRLC